MSTKTKPAPARSDVPIRKVQRRKTKPKKKNNKPVDNARCDMATEDISPSDVTIELDTDEVLHTQETVIESVMTDGLQNTIENTIRNTENTENTKTFDKEELLRKLHAKRNSRIKKTYRNKDVESTKIDSAFCTYCKTTKSLTEFSNSQRKKTSGLVCFICTERMQVTNDKISKLKKAFEKNGMKFDLDQLMNIQKLKKDMDGAREEVEEFNHSCGEHCTENHIRSNNADNVKVEEHNHSCEEEHCTENYIKSNNTENTKNTDNTDNTEKKLEHYDDHEHTKDCKYNHATGTTMYNHETENAVKDECDYNDPQAVSKFNKDTFAN